MFEFRSKNRASNLRLKAMLDDLRARLLSTYNAISGTPAADIKTYTGEYSGTQVTITAATHDIDTVLNAGCSIRCNDLYANDPHHPEVTIEDDGDVTFKALKSDGTVSSKTGITIEYFITGV